MGKNERKKSEKMVDDNVSRTNAGADKIQQFGWDQLGEQTGKANQTYDQASGAYNKFVNGMGGYDPSEYNDLRSKMQSNEATGGLDPNKVKSIQTKNDSNYERGGYNEGEYARLNNGLGGMDPTQAGKVRAGYEDLAKTGGISDGTADAMRRQSASGVQSIYSTLGTQLGKRRAATGFGGGGGETAQLARQGAQEQSKAITGVNAEIGQLRQKGTIAGMGGLSDFEQAAGSGNRQALSSVAQGRLHATDAEADMAKTEQQGRLHSTDAQAELATGAAQQRIQAAGGLVNLYNSSPGYVTDMVKSILASQQSQGTLNSEQAKIMEEISKAPGLFDQIMKGISTIGGAAAGVMGGMGGMGVKMR